MNILGLIYAIPTADTPPANHTPRSDSPTSQLSQSAPSEGNATEWQTQSSSQSVISDASQANGSSQSDIVSSATPSQTTGFTEDRSDVHVTNRSSSLHSTRSNPTGSLSRLRSSSNLPPRPPVPAASPPKTPSESHVGPTSSSPPSPPSLPEQPPRSNGSHKRLGSGSRVDALREEALAATASLQSQQQQHFEIEADLRRGHLTRKSSQDSPPLPALPPSASLEQSHAITPRVPNPPSSQLAASPPRSQSPVVVTRPRGASTLSVKSEASTSKSSQTTLINESPLMGTISQRRTKSSTSSTLAESSTDSPILPDIVSQAKMFPGLSNTSTSQGRLRAASQPVKLPTSTALNSGQIASAQHMSVPAPRKTSSRLSSKSSTSSTANRFPLQLSSDPLQWTCINAYSTSRCIARSITNHANIALTALTADRPLAQAVSPYEFVKTYNDLKIWWIYYAKTSCSTRSMVSRRSQTFELTRESSCCRGSMRCFDGGAKC